MADDRNKKNNPDDDRPDHLKAINETFTPPDQDLQAPDSDIAATPHERVNVGDKEHNYIDPEQRRQQQPPQQPQSGA
jgi:hypothetical protein